MKLADMNAGKALKLLMVKNEVSRTELSQALNLSSVTISGLRNSKVISGANLVKLSEFFSMKASDFLRLGEED
jgi:DNA-binding Xre family transcriptional regulator